MESTPFVHQLLNALGDGCVLLDKEGNCTGLVSERAKNVFEKDPAGLHFTKILALPEGEAKTAADWFKFLFSKRTRFEDICSLGPTKFDHSDKNTSIAITFKPVRNAAGEVESVIMIADDVSIQAQDKKRAELQRQEADMIIARYRTFPAFARCLELYQECIEHLNDFNSHADQDQVEGLRREIHSLKGILGICSLTDLVSTVKVVEWDFLEARKANRLTKQETKSLAEKLKRGYGEFMDLHAEALSLGKYAKDTFRAVQSQKVEHFRGWLKSMAVSPEVFNRFNNYFWRMSLEEILQPLRMYAAMQGARLQKPVEVHIIDCPEIYFEPNILDSEVPAISKVLTKMIQESIEDVEERQLADKPREGQIRISAGFENDTLTITIRDDGRLAMESRHSVVEHQSTRKSA